MNSWWTLKRILIVYKNFVVGINYLLSYMNPFLTKTFPQSLFTNTYFPLNGISSNFLLSFWINYLSMLKFVSLLFPDFQSWWTWPREVGPRDREGLRQRPASAGGRLHLGRQNQRHQRQQPSLWQSKLWSSNRSGNLKALFIPSVLPSWTCYFYQSWI